ncbi:MAG: dTDP-4-dehydrorhamnose 3,5-epimerase [Steroidobacteraceae bacterium]
MLFEPLDIPGAVLVRLERQPDIRGFFARSVCIREFQAHGLPAEFVQSSISYNRRRGTVRGLHFQWAPSREGKLVRCVRGAIHDVLLDLRPDEPTYLEHRAVVLDQDNRDAVFIPAGIAHGFQTLADDSEILYQMTDFHAPEFAAGMRWDDAAFGIEWPITQDVVISDRDAAYPDFDRLRFEQDLSLRTAH